MKIISSKELIDNKNHEFFKTIELDVLNDV